MKHNKNPRPSSSSPAVRKVSWWALSAACGYAGTAIWFLSDDTPCRDQWLPSFCCHDLTGEDKALERALEVGLLLWSAPQAAAATLALRLPGRGRQRALAFVALAACAANNFIGARHMGLVIAAFPGDLVYMVISAGLLFMAMLNLLNQFAILLDADAEDARASRARRSSARSAPIN